VSIGVVDLEHLAGMLQRALRALDQLDGSVDRSVLFSTAPSMEEVRRWQALLDRISTNVQAAYQFVDDESAEAATAAAPCATVQP
jgi:hypothetical protein